jgi:hypothetical protein
VATHVTRWASDPYSYGAYSYVPANSKRVSSAACLQLNYQPDAMHGGTRAAQNVQQETGRSCCLCKLKCILDIILDHKIQSWLHIWSLRYLTSPC